MEDENLCYVFNYVKNTIQGPHKRTQVTSCLKNKSKFLEEAVIELEETKSEDRLTREGSAWKKSMIKNIEIASFQTCHVLVEIQS